METTPRFLNGVFAFEGKGLVTASPLGGLGYVVPADKRAQLVYLRAGNSSDALICISLVRDGTPMRLFPVGAKGSIHVPLAVVEDIFPETRIEVYVSAPAGVTGEAVIDIGILEV